MRNIERAKMALEDLYPEATVQVESRVVNLSPYSEGLGAETSTITCYGFNTILKSGQRVVCSEMYTDDYFSEMSIDAIRSYLQERCVVVPDGMR